MNSRNADCEDITNADIRGYGVGYHFCDVCGHGEVAWHHGVPYGGTVFSDHGDSGHVDVIDHLLSFPRRLQV